MQVFYQVYNDWTEKQKIILNSFGYRPKEGFYSIDILDIESNKGLLDIIDNWGLEKFPCTQFHKEDYEKSNLFVFVGVWENGFPQPESVDGYLNATYDLSDYCNECGIGAIQNRPFRIKKIPQWGNNMIFELNWILDEFFVRKDIYESFFLKKYNLDWQEVLLHKTSKVIDNVIQLRIPITNIKMNIEKTPFETCEKCKRKKFTPNLNGFIPGFKSPVFDHIFKCSEDFGSGLDAHKRIFITRPLLNELRALGLNPTIWPVDPEYSTT